MKTRTIIVIICTVLFSISIAKSQDFEPMVQKAKEYYDNKQYDSAAVLYEAALPLIEQKYGAKDTGYYVKQLQLTGLSFYYIQDYEKAESYFLKEKSIYDTLDASDDTGYASALFNLAILFHDMGKYNLSLSYFEKVRDIRLIKLGPENADYGRTLMWIGVLYGKTGKYYEAIPVLNGATVILKNSLGIKNFDYVMSLNDLGLAYNRIGNNEAALSIFEESSALIKEIEGYISTYYAISLVNIAGVYEDIGNLMSAIKNYENASIILREVKGINNSDYAITINNLALAYHKLGNDESSLPILKESSEIFKDLLGEKHPYYGKSLMSLASVFKSLGNYDSALIYITEATEIFKESLGEKHSTYAVSLLNLADINAALGNYQIAINEYDSAKMTYREVFGPKHPNYSIILNQYALLQYKLGNYDDAKKQFEEALTIIKETTGSNNIKYAKSLYNLAWLYYTLGDYYTALTMFKDVYNIFNKDVCDNFSFMSQNDKEQYMLMIMDKYESYLSFLIEVHTILNTSNSVGYDNELLLKGIILSSVSAMQQTIYEIGDTSLLLLYENLRILKKQIFDQEQKPLTKRLPQLDSLKQQVNYLERDLTIRSQNFRDFQSSFKIKWEDIQRQLMQNEITVEFSNFRYFDKERITDSIFYCALLLRKTDSLPQFVFLCEEKQLKNAIPLTGADSKTINPFYQDLTLYDLIWKPIDSLLQGINTVYFAPSGLLNSVAMAAIQCPDGKVLSEKYNLVQLSSTRTLAMPEEPVNITDAVIYGGIKYDPDTTAWLVSTGKYKKEESDILAYNPPTFRGITRGGWVYLPGTKKEAALVAAKLAKKEIDTTTFTGINALEESFYSLSGNNSPSVIHISTHGYYYPDTVSDEYRKNMMFSATGDIQFKYADDPLLRSGLILAGGNNTWKGLLRPEGLEDGILTAREVSNMNLLNTELVVLSACQTGQGDVKGSEGVEGLQRGFKMAGVHYLIMSLWQVPDKESTEFMEHFYDLWPGKMDIRSAFHETQLKMMRKYPDEPYKWAGFVLME